MMEEYKFKYYWAQGYTTFGDVAWGLSYAIFDQANKAVTENKLIEKIDVYKGTKKIATFYK